MWQSNSKRRRAICTTLQLAHEQVAGQTVPQPKADPLQEDQQLLHGYGSYASADWTQTSLQPASELPSDAPWEQQRLRVRQVHLTVP